MDDLCNVRLEERSLRNNHRSGFVLFTGLSGAGKTTLARQIERMLFNRGIQTFVLDGDDFRAGLNRDLGFESHHRKENQRRIAEVGRLFLNAGIVVLVSSIAPLAENRNQMRSLVDPDPFIEVYVKCPLEICEQRDPKGLYAKARNGIVQNFTGLSSRYEEPTNSEVIVETDKTPINTCATKITTQILKAIKLND